MLAEESIPGGLGGLQTPSPSPLATTSPSRRGRARGRHHRGGGGSDAAVGVEGPKGLVGERERAALDAEQRLAGESCQQLPTLTSEPQRYS